MSNALFIFWRAVRLKPSDDKSKPGTSWIELFVAFHLFGGDGIIEQPGHLGRRASFKQQLSHFILNSKRLHRHHLEIGSQDLVKLSRARGRAMESYSIDRHTPAITSYLCMSSERSHIMHDMLCTLQRTVSLKDGTARLKLGGFKFPKQPPWHRFCGSYELARIINSHATNARDRI